MGFDRRRGKSVRGCVAFSARADPIADAHAFKPGDASDLACAGEGCRLQTTAFGDLNGGDPAGALRRLDRLADVQRASLDTDMKTPVPAPAPVDLEYRGEHRRLGIVTSGRGQPCERLDHLCDANTGNG